MGRSCPRPQTVIGYDLSAVFVDAHTLPGSLASRIANTSSGLPYGHPRCPFPPSRPRPSAPSGAFFSPFPTLQPPSIPPAPTPSHPRLLVLPPFPIPPAHLSPSVSTLQPPSIRPSNSVTPAPSRPLAVTHPSRTPLPAPFRSPDPIHPARPIPSHPRLLVLPPFPIARARLSPPLSALQLPSIPPVQFRHTRTFSSSRRSPSLAHTSPRRFPLFRPHPSGPPHALSPKCSRHSHRPQRQAQRVPRRWCLLPPKSSAIPPRPSRPGLPALSEPHQHLRLPLALPLTTYQPVGMIFVKGGTRCRNPPPNQMPG